MEETTETALLPRGFEKRTVLARGVEDGVPWFTCRAPMWGAVNGYALLPEGHPWRELDLQTSDYDEGPDVHGGVTFGPTGDGWIGFDTAHSGDVWPDMPQFGGPTSWDKRWTEEAVAEEARSLARQVAEAQP